MPEDKESRRAWLEYSAIGLMFPASITVGLVIGYYLDKWLKTSPYLFMLFTLYGIGAGFYNAYKIAQRTGKNR